jgi:curved DNA-binding protein CbpA
MELYRLLGLTIDSTAAEIRKAYLVQARALHPDKNPAPDAKQQFQALSRAYEVLSDPEQRARYDKQGDEFLEEQGEEDAFAEYLRKFAEASVSESDIVLEMERASEERKGRESGITQQEEEMLQRQYVRFEGKIGSIMQFVLCSKKAAEMYINKCIEEGTLQKLKHWKTNNNKRKRKQ